MNTSASETIDACAFEFPDNQGKNYRKTEFILHSRVAEIIGDQLSRVFYNDENETWSIHPSELRDIVMTNILQEGDADDDSSTLYSRYPIYGSAIAFEPGVWNSIVG